MAMPFKDAVLTDSGAALFTRAQAGECRIQFTRILVGDGTYTDEEKAADALQTATALKSEKNSYAIMSAEVVSDYSLKLSFLITNQDPDTEENLVTEGYYINEIGLFAKDADEDDDTEILYSIAVTSGENGDFMPPYNGYNPARIYQDYYVTVNNALEVKIETSGVYALAVDFNDLKARVAAAAAKSFDFTIPTEGWESSEGSEESEEDYPYHIDIINAAITEDMTPSAAFDRESLSVASQYGICPTIETGDGYLRIYSASVPEEEMTASCLLIPVN